MVRIHHQRDDDDSFWDLSEAATYVFSSSGSAEGFIAVTSGGILATVYRWQASKHFLPRSSMGWDGMGWDWTDRHSSRCLFSQ